ncbi:MAG: type IX secretion system protein PorQ [Bacteroidetes bacterium]|nr:type IX secretion system protein PorQ [Bacteroidota bacterium]
MKKALLFSVLFLTVLISSAQIGGESTYEFLSLSPSARVTALGGTNVTLFDQDLTTQLSNPASLNPLMHRRVAFGTTAYPGGINFGNLSYAHRFKIPGTFGFGLQYVAYGKFKETDEAGNVTGRFNAGEMNIYAGYGYQFGKLFSAGVNAKFIYSQLAGWSSIGMATDFAVMLHDTAHLLTASIVAKNIGTQFKAYNRGVREPLPFDLQAGFAFGFKHVPFRFHLTFHDLYRWNIRYTDPAESQNSDLFADTSTKEKKYFADKLFRHIIIGLEVNIKKVVFLHVAYNHLRQQELRLATRRGLPGFSFGLRINIRQFDFNYALQPMAQGQTLNYFTLSVNTAGFVKRKKIPEL